MHVLLLIFSKCCQILLQYVGRKDRVRRAGALWKSVDFCCDDECFAFPLSPSLPGPLLRVTARRQVTSFHVHSYELSAGAASKEYLGNLQGRVSEEKIQEALRGIGKDLNAEYVKHAEVMATTREQLQRLERQVPQRFPSW